MGWRSNLRIRLNVHAIPMTREQRAGRGKRGCGGGRCPAQTPASAATARCVEHVERVERSVVGWRMKAAPRDALTARLVVVLLELTFGGTRIVGVAQRKGATFRHRMTSGLRLIVARCRLVGPA